MFFENACLICNLEMGLITFAAFMNQSNMHTKIGLETKYFTTYIACS